jgi:hypothetical protein
MVGGLWGAFVGALFCLEIAGLASPVRRYIGGALGLVPSAFSGVLLGWQIPSTIEVGVFAIILGIFADRWVRHIATFP